VVCGGLLIAAPLAVLLTDRQHAGSTREPDGVFTGGADGTDDGTGHGGAGVTTGSAQFPEPGAAPVDTAAGPAAGGVGTDGTGGTSADGGWTGTTGGGGTAAQPGTGGAQPATSGNAASGDAAPANTVPGNTAAGTDGGTAPAPQQAPAQQQDQESPAQDPEPAPEKDANGVPCPCRVVNGVLTSLSTLGGGLLPG
jgi:hypothetical protein